MNAHTPGPWRVRPHDIGLTVETEAGEPVALPCSTPTVSAPGNARLIAAAPALLAALKWAVDCPDMNLDDMDPDTIAALDGARQAIAKAEGTL